jgi:hypothetical protein
MMTEIGLAQRRLFDDDETQYAGRQLIPETAASVPSQPNTMPTDEMTLVPVIEIVGPREMGYINNEGGPDYMYQTSDTIAYQYAEAEQQQQVLSSNGFSQSAASYNLFESSLQPSRSPSSDNISHLRPTDTLQVEGQHGPRRWNSMQDMLSSPHDTEPNSSLLSAKASRSKSDNAALDVVPQLYLQQQQQRAASPDDLPRLIAVEIPAEPKKRGRPKKQTVPEAAENHEHPQQVVPEAGEIIYNIDNKPEKRKQGRPPKNAKADSLNQQDQTNPILNQPEAIPPSHEPKPPSNILPQEHPENSVLHIELPQNNHHLPSEQTIPEPIKFTTPPTKEPKKKKLKRGKTTSITLKKTYDPDIEPDVIWIDETTPNPNPQLPNTSEPPHPSTGKQPPATTIVQVQPDPPKKRGRKRKKTSDQQQAVEETPTADTTHPNLKQSQEPVSVTENSTPETNNLNHLPHDNPGDKSQPTPPLKINENPPETPKKTDREPKTTGASNTEEESGKMSSKGPGKHSPISTGRVPYRVGLSRRARIAPLLKVVKR